MPTRYKSKRRTIGHRLRTRAKRVLGACTVARSYSPGRRRKSRHRYYFEVVSINGEKVVRRVMRIPGNPLFDSKVTGIEPSHLSPVSVAMMPGSQLPATPPPPRDIRRQIGVPQHVFARILGVSPRTLADYEAGGEPSETARRRLIEVSRLFQAMGAMVPLDTLGPWLQKPNDTFCGLTPVQVIDRGEIDRLWTMVAMLEAGVAG